jgi:hypothetical protein
MNLLIAKGGAHARTLPLSKTVMSADFLLRTVGPDAHRARACSFDGQHLLTERAAFVNAKGGASPCRAEGRWRMMRRMKRTILIAAAVLALVAPAAAQQPVRRVEGRTLVSSALPPVHLKFGKEFNYVGTQSFVLYESAEVEQYFFVDAAGGRIRRMFMVQFEGSRPSSTHAYDYQIKDTVSLGGLDFMYDTNVVNVPAFRKQYPDSDAARAATFLEGKGYRMEGDDIVYQRYVRVVDEAKRNELLVVYYESLQGTGFTAADLSASGSAAAYRERLFREVQKRALKGFKVSK